MFCINWPSIHSTNSPTPPQCEKYKDTLSCIMVTYPSTFGVFEDGIV